jgi:hypothetical protein
MMHMKHFVFWYGVSLIDQLLAIFLTLFDLAKFLEQNYK